MDGIRQGSEQAPYIACDPNSDLPWTIDHLVDQSRPSSDHGNHIFQVVAPEQVTLPPSFKGCELRRNKQRGRGDRDHQVVGQCERLGAA